jgi:hypothetical protein
LAAITSADQHEKARSNVRRGHAFNPEPAVLAVLGAQHDARRVETALSQPSGASRFEL